MTNIKKSSGQRGVALLFALGVLSLLLVMGVAFLGNALISQKIAVNSQEASSAKSLARTAVDRALAHLTLFQLIQSREINNSYASDASSVFSRMTSSGTITVPDNSTKRDLLYYDTGSANTSRLSVSRGKEGTKKWYDGSKSLAEWVYVHEDGTFSDGQSSNGKRVIGRFAYQVLPQTSKSRLSLFAVTSGATRQVGQNVVSGARIPQKHRWGVEIDEIVIPDIDVNKTFSMYWKFENNPCDPLYEFDNFINVFSGKVGETAYNPLYDDNVRSENYKRWLEYIFAEGRGRIAREAYWGGNGWYPRFNLGDFNNYWNFKENKKSPVRNTDNTWYQRFLELDEPPANAESETKEIDKIKNSDKVIELLTGGVNTDDKDPSKLQRYTEGWYLDGQYEAIIGLPFLRRIGHNDEKGGFKKIEYLRKQIAANLNDYCDADYIPTSNIPADNWADKVDATAIDDGDAPDPDKLPVYTGNEKTPYINELAFGFKISNAKFNSGAKYTFTADVESEVLVELIRVYKELAQKNADGKLKIEDFSFKGLLKDLKITLKVTIAGGTAQMYETVDDKEVAIGAGKNLDGAPVSSSREEVLIDAPYTIENLKFTGSGPYWLNRVQPTKKGTLKVPIEVDLSESIKSIFQVDKQVTRYDIVNPSKITVEIEKVSFNFGNLVLLAPDPAGGTVGVDFVRVQCVNGQYHDTPLAEKLLDGATDLSALSGSKYRVAYCAAMEVKDPRQNLNANFDERDGNDWQFGNEEKYPSFEFNGGEEVPSIEERTWGDDLDARKIKGAKNSCSSPKSDGDLNENRDRETVVDPAWWSDDEHISTAVIRNAPMQSPWELGFIHRGIPFQTINLKGAGGIDGDVVLAENAHDPNNFKKWSEMETESKGTKYEHGDAGILDQIKMTEFTKSYGKLDFSALINLPENSGDDTFLEMLNFQLFKGLFENLKSHKASVFVEKVTDRDKAPQFADGDESAPGISLVEADLDKVPESKLRSRVFSNEHFQTKFKKTTDAASEEIIGKTINLIEGEGCSLPNAFRIVVVAQTIRDANGQVAKLDASGEPRETSASLGKFDAAVISNGDLDSNMYFDEILGECRMLVTVEKIHYMEGNKPRSRLRVKQIEYLD